MVLIAVYAKHLDYPTCVLKPAAKEIRCSSLESMDKTLKTHKHVIISFLK